MQAIHYVMTSTLMSQRLPSIGHCGPYNKCNICIASVALHEAALALHCTKVCYLALHQGTLPCTAPCYVRTAAPCYAALHCTMLCCAAPCYTVLHYVKLHCTAPCCTVLHCTMLCCVALHHAALCCTAPCYICLKIGNADTKPLTIGYQWLSSK